MKFDPSTFIKCAFWTKILLKKGQNTLKSKGTPLDFLSYGEALFGYFYDQISLKGLVYPYPPGGGGGSL
jgi:hypothetical protein